jgi:hypothetical protein
MPLADLDFAGLFTEKFLVAVGATTGSLAAFAIASSFWLVKQVVASDATGAKIGLVRWFMAMCGLFLAVTATATIALAVNNRDRVVRAGEAAKTAVIEKQAVERDLQTVLVEAEGVKAKHDKISANLKAYLQAAENSPPIKVRSDWNALLQQVNPKGSTPELDRLLEKYAAPQIPAAPK